MQQPLTHLTSLDTQGLSSDDVWNRLLLPDQHWIHRGSGQPEHKEESGSALSSEWLNKHLPEMCFGSRLLHCTRMQLARPVDWEIETVVHEHQPLSTFKNDNSSHEICSHLNTHLNKWITTSSSAS